MKNVKYFAWMSAIIAALIVWSIIHGAFWKWALPDDRTLRMIGFLSTSFFIPGFAISALLDWAERSRK